MGRNIRICLLYLALRKSLAFSRTSSCCESRGEGNNGERKYYAGAEMLEGAQGHGKARETHLNYAKRGGLHSRPHLHFGEWS